MQRRKIRVLRIINRFNIGGPTYNATFLTKFLSDEFVTMLVGGFPEEGESDSLHIPRGYGIEPILLPELIRQPNIISDRKALSKLKSIIKDFKPDIVHTHASKAGALGRQAAIECKVPVIVHTFHGHVFHSYFGKFKTWIFKTIERRLAAKTTGVIAISSLQKEELCWQHKIAPEDKLTVIPLGFDLQQFQQDIKEKRIKTRETYGIADDEIAIAIIGRLSPIKNHSFFIDVMAKVQNHTTKKLKIFIVGDGEERPRIEQKIEKDCPNAPIVLTSWIKDIASFNPGMDIICLTSNNEGTPVSLIEAQACNVAVVSTDVGGVRDIVSEGDTGFICPPNDIDYFAKKILFLTENENNLKKMSQNGWSFVEHKFGYQRLVNDVENYYKEKLREKGYTFA